MRLPPLVLLRQLDTHRLIPSRYLPQGDSVLRSIADNNKHLQALFELDAATNDRVTAGRQALPGIGLEELVFGVPNAMIVNASFCHAHPLGSRFNGPERGAWYAGFTFETSRAEVSFHRTVQLAEIGRFDDSVTYDDYLSDFSASFHDLRSAQGLRRYLNRSSYVASQSLADELLRTGSLGVVYPSVRHAGGTCVACFRPALVANVRRGQTWRFTWNGSPEPTVTRESAIPPTR